MSLQLPMYVLTSLVLTLLPIPEMIKNCWPNWIVLYFFWLACFRPRTNLLLWFWGIGLLLDSLQATYLGVHVLGLLLMNLLIQQHRSKFLMYPVIQQTLIVTMSSGIYIVFTQIHNSNMPFWHFMVNVLQVSLATGCIWPWIEFSNKTKMFSVSKKMSH